MQLLIGSAVIVIVLMVVASIKKSRHLATLRAALAQPFPAEWDAILSQNLPPYKKLPQALRDELQQEIASLVARDLEHEVEPADTFYRVCDLARGDPSASRRAANRPPPSPSPRMTEPWFC